MSHSSSPIEKLLLFTFSLMYFTTCPADEFNSCTVISHVPFGCQYCECCERPWVNFDQKGLEMDLMNNLFGQHIAQSAVINALKGFLNNPKPDKALALSFNGFTGSGKTFLSRLIAKHLYKKGEDSDYVHIYVANLHFPHKSRVSEYQDRIREDIKQYTKRCHRSLFIFEEVEKMPPGTIDSLKPFLEYYDFDNGVNYKKNIFIFLSNSGSQSILNKTLEFWADGKDREDMSINDLDQLVSKGSYNEKGGFQYSELLNSNLIDIFVPFLPLEKQHVIKCIKVELKKRNAFMLPEIIKKVTDSLVYIPKDIDLYSTSGCKRLSNKIDLFIQN